MRVHPRFLYNWVREIREFMKARGGLPRRTLSSSQ